MRAPLPLFTLAFAAVATCALAAGQDWAIYGGTAEGTRYSSLTQITRDNVGQAGTGLTFRMEDGGDPQTHPASS